MEKQTSIGNMIWVCPKLYWDDREDEIPKLSLVFTWMMHGMGVILFEYPSLALAPRKPLRRIAPCGFLFNPYISSLKDRMKHTPFSNWICHRNRFGNSNGISSIIFSSRATECKSLCFIHIHRRGYPCALSGLYPNSYQ